MRRENTAEARCGSTDHVMVKRPRAVRQLTLAVALTLAALGGRPGWGANDPTGNPGAETAASAMNLAEQLGMTLRDYLPMLQGAPDSETIRAILFDARRTVVEIDRLTANASVYGISTRDKVRIEDVAAVAHLRLALFETHGLGFDVARSEIERARSLSAALKLPDFRIEWMSVQDGAPGDALVTRFRLLTLVEFEAALASIWFRAREVPFEFGGYGQAELLDADLVRIPPPPDRSLDARLLARGRLLLRRALDSGHFGFTVPLPPGLYRLEGNAMTHLSRTFVIPEVSDIDPVVIDEERFSLKVDPKPGPRGPHFFLNGIEVTDLTTMPYGVYRVESEEGYFKGAPDMIRFIPGDGIPDKTRTSWTIFVPTDGSTDLRFERLPLRERLFRGGR